MRNVLPLLVLLPGFAPGAVLKDGFVENMGQLPNEVLYYTYDGVKVLRSGEIILGEGGFRLEDASLERVEGLKPSEGLLNLFTPEGSFVHVPVYRQILFHDVYPGIDMVLTKEGRVFEVQWLVHPGASVEDIELVPIGNMSSFLDVRAYQGSAEIPIAMRSAGSHYTFEVSDYDRRDVLVIDPVAVVSYTPYEVPYGMNVDDSGYVYMTGYISNTTGMGDWDLFVSKLSPDLSSLISTAIIATDMYDLGFSIDFDSEGNLYVAGWTFGMDFGQDYNLVIYGDTGLVDAFVIRMRPSLDSILTVARIASPAMDQAFTVQYSSDTVYVGGVASDVDNFSVSPIVYGSHGGTYDNSAFITALSPDLMQHYGTAVVASPSSDYLNGIYVKSGRAILYGYTYDPTTFSSDRNIYGTTGNGDAFVTVLSSSLDSHLGTVILASDSLDVAGSVITDSAGNIYVAGYTTNSSAFSTSRIIKGNPGHEDIFITYLDSSLNHIRTLIAASPSSDLIGYGSDRAIAPYGGDFLVLATTDFPTQLAAPVEIVNCGTGGGYDAVVLRINGEVDSVISISIATGNGDDEGTGDMVVRGNRVYFSANLSGNYDISTYLSPSYQHGTPDTTSPNDLLVVSFDGECFPVSHMEAAQFQILQSGHEIALELPHPGYVGMDVFDPAGRPVMRITSGFLPSGRHTIPLHLRSGKYILRIRYGESIYTRKIILR